MMRQKKFIFQGTMHKNRIKNDEKTFQIITLCVCILWAKKSRAGKIKNNILMHVLYLFWIFNSLLSTEFSHSLEKKNGSSNNFSVVLYPIFFYTYYHGVFILGLFILFGSVSSSSSSKQFNLPPFSLINVLWQEQRTSDDFYLERVSVNNKLSFWIKKFVKT